MLLLTFRDLAYRKVRFIVVTILGAVVFALLFVMTGLVNQFNLEPADTVEQFGADEWVLPEGVSAPFTSVSVMPAAALDTVRRHHEGAGGHHPVERRPGRSPRGGRAGRFRTGRARSAAGGRGPSSRRPRARWRSTARSTSRSAKEVTVAGAPFTVVGLTEATTVLAGIPFAYLDLPEAQMLAFTSATDVISSVLVAGDVGPLPAGLVSLASDDVVAQTLRNRSRVRSPRSISCGHCCGSWRRSSSAPSSTWALDRQRDFAVLKAVGRSTPRSPRQPRSAGRLDRAGRRRTRSDHPGVPRPAVPASGDRSCRAPSGSFRSWRW